MTPAVVVSAASHFGFRSITPKGMHQFIWTLQKGQASLNTGQVRMGGVGGVIRQIMTEL